MYPGIHISVRFRTICTRLPVHGTPKYRHVPTAVSLRPLTRKTGYRSIHSTRLLRNNESKQALESESTMTSRAAKLAKEAAAANAPAVEGATTAAQAAAAAAASTAPAVKPKKTLWQKVKDEAVHYWHGTKLLGLEIRISSKLTWKLLNGGHLTRREARQVNRQGQLGIIQKTKFFFKKTSFVARHLTLCGWCPLQYSSWCPSWNCCSQLPSNYSPTCCLAPTKASPTRYLVTMAKWE